MKWFSICMLIIWLALLGLGCFWAYNDFDNAVTLNRGGYLYSDDGEVIGMWDGWDKADYPTWLLVLWLPISLLISMPIWWMVAYWMISIWLIVYYIYPHIMSGGVDESITTIK